MKHIKLTMDEQELTLTTTRTSDTIDVYTSDRVYMRKLDKLCNDYPDAYTLVWTDTQATEEGTPIGKRYQFSKRFLKFGKPASEARRASALRNINKLKNTP